MTQISGDKNTISHNLALQYLVREPVITKKKASAIVLLHGVGSNEEDLFQLADQLPEDFYIISPRGKFTLGAGRFAWYNVDFSTGKPLINAAEELSSRGVITTFIAQIKMKYDLEEVYLGGFSQGAIMSFSVGLNNPDDVAGIISFSGRILEENQKAVVKNADLNRLEVFLAHGIQDGTLPVHYARQAKGFLQQLGVRLSYHEYNIGHQINGAALNDLNNWLATRQQSQ